MSVGHVHGLLLVVGDEHGRHVHLVVQAPQPVAQLLAHLRVEGAERLVEQQQARLDGERPGQGHALALAARELGRHPVGEGLEVHELEQLGHALADLVLRALADLEPEGDVAVHAHVLERGVVLEHEADVAPLRRQAGGVGAVELDHARVGRLEPGHDPQQRRLAAAARAEQGGQRARRDIDGDVVERDERPEPLADVAGAHAHRRTPLIVRTVGRKRFISSSATMATCGQGERDGVGAAPSGSSRSSARRRGWRSGSGRRCGPTPRPPRRTRRANGPA